MSGGGSSTTTSSSTVPPQFLNAYQNTVNRATQVASTPYQAYSGQLVAGFTPQQLQAQQQVSALQGGYQGDLNNAQSAINASQTPLWGSTQQFSPSAVEQYEDPYQSQVVNATEGQIANTDAQQQAQLAGNAGAAGAFGGDRMGVAQGILGGQQAVANNSTLAGLNQSNYTQALGEFNNQQQAQLSANEANSWLDSQAGYADANLANESNNLALTDTSALAQSGLTQQQQAQAGLNTNYEQWQAQQAFPYQQTGWLANITEGIGSNVGGSSTTTQTNNWTGGRVPRSSGGIVPQHMRMMPHFDGGGSILGDTPDPANSYIPTSGGSSGGGKGAPGFAQIAPQQQNPLANPATDIGAAAGAVSLYKNLGLGSLFGGTSAAAPEMASMAANGVPATWGATAAVPAGYWGSGAAATDAALAGGDLTGASTGAAAAASSPGFLGSLGSAVDAGAADVGGAASAVGDALASGAGAVGDAIGAGAAAVGGGLADAATWLLAFLHNGGAVQPQHHAKGGIVVPFPSHLARGGIAASGNAGEMPYSMAPPVGLMNGTTGGIGSFMPGSAGPSMTAATSAPTGIGGTFGNAGASSTMPYRKGGIVVPFTRKHFDDGGATEEDPQLTAMRSDELQGETPAAQAAPQASASPGISAGAAQYQPEKPNLWLPALAAVATSALGEHHQAGHNIAQGVLSGLGVYSAEDKTYQEGKQKAASIQQEAQRLADDAQFHKDQIGVENTRNAQEGTYQAGMLNNDNRKTQIMSQHDTAQEGIESQRVGVEKETADSNAAYRSALLDGMGSPVGTTPDGKMVYSNKMGHGMTTEDGQPYAGPVGPMPAAVARNAVTTQGQQWSHDDRVAKLGQQGAQFSDEFAQKYGESARKLADSIYIGANNNGHQMTMQQAADAALQQMPRFAPNGGKASPAASNPLLNMPNATSGLTNQPATPPVPKPGAVVNGYTFKGGNPADPNSWSQ